MSGSITCALNTRKTFFAVASSLSLMLGLFTCSEPEKPKPEVTAANPTEGPIGTPVTINGKNLASAQSVSFGSASSSIASKSDAQVVTVVPPGVSPGALTLSVKTDGGTSNTIPFTVLHSVPEITSIEPAKGATGTEVALIGKYLSTASAVTFGAKTTSSFISKSDTEVKLLIPDGLALGALDVTVTTAGGTSEKATFTVVGKPVITSLSPAIGPVGTKVNIAGSYFEESTKILFGEGEADFTVKTASLIEATVPASAVTGKVKVYTPGGEAISPGNFTVKDGPTITNFTPATGIVGTVVTINGENFDTGSVVVKFGTGKATVVNVVSPAKITATVPATATTGKITVETAAGSAFSATNFTVIGGPAVTSFTPTSGGTGIEVVITGTDFINVGTVKFNSTTVTAGNYNVISPTQLKANVPAGAASGKISVTTPAGTGVSGTNFTVLAPPTITSFNPVNGAQGSDVVITGTGFTNITSVSINNVEAGTGNFNVDSPTQITAKVPASATSGKIKVTNPLGSATSMNTFYVTPFISTINPVSGTPGTTITLTGTNMLGAKVKFNATEVTPLTNTINTITVAVPSIAAGATNVTVVNSGGTSNSKTFTVKDPVVLTEIVATANIKDQLLICLGTNLSNATKVLFGTTEALVITNTSKVVTVKIPASLSVGNYPVKIVTSNGTSNEKMFELLSVQNPNTGVVTLVNGASVAALPPGYVPPVANQWENLNNDAERITIEETNNGYVIYFEDEDRIYATNVIVDQSINYIEFTISGVRYVGVWLPYIDGEDCFHYMTLISAESGQQFTLRVATYYGSCPN